MKARLHPTPALQKAVDEYAEEKIKGIQSRAHEAVMKERNDIATRATYLCLLACYQAGLSRRTLVKIQNCMTGPVADKYNEYRNDQLADYASRRRLPVDTAKKFLASHLISQ